MAKVSLIVTVYNPNEKYFVECLKSIQEQSLHDIEVILIDDGSENKIAKICDQFVAEDSRFKVWHKENEGVSIASNFGIEKVTSEYFTFVDHDDRIDQCMCEKSYLAAKKMNVDTVIWNYTSFSAKFEKHAYYIGPREKLYQKEDISLLRKMIIDPMADKEQQISLLGANWGKLYRTDKIKGNQQIRFPDHIMGGEDALFTLKALDASQNAYFFNEYLYYYRQSESSFTKRFRKNMPEEEFAITSRFEKEFEGEAVEKVFAKYYCNLFISLLVNYIWNDGNNQRIKTKKLQVREWLNIKEMNDAIQSYKQCDFNRKKKIFFFMAQRKRINCIMILSYIFKRLQKEQRDF